MYHTFKPNLVTARAGIGMHLEHQFIIQRHLAALGEFLL